MFLSKRPKLLLHVGSYKTGTTSLQSSLASNSTKLLSLGGGVFYCLLRPDRINHAQLVRAIKSEFLSMNYDDVMMHKYFPGLCNLKMSAKATVEYIKNNFFESNSKTLLLSSENFYMGTGLMSSRLSDKDEKRRYNEYVMSYINEEFNEFDIKVVIYLRRQDDMLESMYNQMYKTGKRYNAEEKEIVFENGYLKNAIMQEILANEDMKMFCDYYFQLCQWSNIYGKENLIVRVYEKSQLPRGTVYDFYKHVLCLDDSEIEVLLAEGRVENESVKRDIVEYVTAMHRDGLYKVDEEKILMLSKKSSLDFLSKNNKNILTAKQASNLLEHYKESNEKVAREYLGREDGILFRDKLRDEADDYKGLSHEATFHISKEMILLYREENERLKEDKERLKEDNKRLRQKRLPKKTASEPKNELQSKTNELLNTANAKLVSKNKSLSDLKAKNQALETKLKNLQNSTSWKITKPFRVITRFLRGIRNRIRRSK